MLWSQTCNFFGNENFLKKLQVLDGSSAFQKKNTTTGSANTSNFSAFSKKNYDWIKSLSKSKWTGQIWLAPPYLGWQIPNDVDWQALIAM